MTVLRSREVLTPRSPPPQTPTPRKKKKPSPRAPPPPPAAAIEPSTPGRTDAPSATPRLTTAAAANVAASSPELGLGAPPLPGLGAPRRSLRLASRSPDAASAGSKGPAMGSGDGDSGELEWSEKKGKRARDADGVGGSACRSSHSEEEAGGRAVGFDLNFPVVESPSGNVPSGNGSKRTEEGGKAVDLSVSSESSSEEERLPQKLVSKSRAVRRRVELDRVIEIESDGEEVEVDMVACSGERFSWNEKGKGILVDDDVPSMEVADFLKFLDLKISHAYDLERGDRAEEEKRQARRYSEEEKGKHKLVVDEDWLTLGGHEANLGIESVRTTLELQPETLPANRRRESDRQKARELAPKFAFFKPEDEEESEGWDSTDSLKDDPADWPGPFSTAVKIINDREKRLQSRQLNSVAAVSKSPELKIEWMPSVNRRVGHFEHQVPSLRDMAVKALSENAAEIESLEGIPDELRHKLSWHICKSRKMDEHVLDLFVRGSPTEITVTDCSWATEEQFELIFGRADTNRLAVLQLDLCGRCLPDYILSSTLARSRDNLPSLTTISLKGAYRLSDDGLNALASSAPILSSLDLGQCSLITSAGIISLLEKLQRVLRELHLDDCNIDATLILPALNNLKKLEVLSVAGIESVTNRFVHGLVSVHGSDMKELVLTGCKQLTTTSVKAIGENCPQLCSLDLRDLGRLNDHALVHLANGCTSLRKLMLRHNPFSDKAIAALLEASGGSLAEISLNNIKEVSNFTAQAIAIRCSLNLRILDLSFCRKMTDEGLGLIVDSCSYLRILKVFGSRQITSTFLVGHSNSNVKIIGLEGSILQHLEMPGFS
uniref:DNA repair protein rhp7 n=1 Tax=Anthurium amnicola TaxID=1678845 RepID=A0A1D1Z5G4_9ARAE